MHRVELKETLIRLYALFIEVNVPNAPCGVESYYPLLVYIVCRLFLMHRVELKVNYSSSFPEIFSDVPNAPCGVESSNIDRK